MLCCCAAIDNTEGLWYGIELPGQTFFGELADHMQGSAAEKLIHCIGIRADLANGEFRRQFCKKRLQRGLCCSTQNCSDTVILHQLRDSRYAGTKIVYGKRLCFVKNYNAVSNIVQLAAAGRAAAV